MAGSPKFWRIQKIIYSFGLTKLLIKHSFTHSCVVPHTCILLHEVECIGSYHKALDELFCVIWFFVSGRLSSHNSPDFEESLKVVNLTQGHWDQDQGFEEWPHNHSGVCAFVDDAVDLVPNVHVVLLVFDSWKPHIYIYWILKPNYPSLKLRFIWVKRLHLASLFPVLFLSF